MTIPERSCGAWFPLRSRCGVDHKTAWMIVAEIGVDMTVFEDAKHLASWAGLCPGNRESGGKRMSGRTRKANRYVRRAMCQAAWAAAHTKNTFLSAFYRRMQVRKGPQKAVMALAHHLILITYNILKRGEEYVEVGGDFYDRRNKPKAVSRMVARLTKLGYEVTLTPIAPEGVVEEQPEPRVSVDSASEFRLDLLPEEETPIRPPIQKPKRGRPCKCAERGINCKHKIGLRPNLLESQQLKPGEFS